MLTAVHFFECSETGGVYAADIIAPGQGRLRRGLFNGISTVSCLPSRYLLKTVRFEAQSRTAAVIWFSSIEVCLLINFADLG